VTVLPIALATSLALDFIPKALALERADPSSITEDAARQG
jgi:hypothetical protein